MNETLKGTIVGSIVVIVIAIIVGLIFGFFFWFLPTWNVWSSALSGKGELKKADWNRQVEVQEAKAKFDASTLLAKAEIERAKGVAQANKIIGDSLEHNEAYLRYLWIDNLKNEHNQVIYVPTETNLPILEANRFNHPTSIMRSKNND